jgi:hypothetical protein
MYFEENLKNILRIYARPPLTASYNKNENQVYQY